MKNILFTFLLFSLAVANAQVNLVVNPSFEDTVHCPSATGDMDKATGWSSYKGSPDYFNTCSPQGIAGVGIPNNFEGYQQAAGGNAYAAFFTFLDFVPNLREIIGGQLVTTLNAGTKYFASIKVALSIHPSTGTVYASDKMGISFSTIPFDASHPAPINNNAKIYSSSIITDTLNWTRIFGSFIADSAYEYIMLGNFFDDTHTDTLKLNTTLFGTPAAYYFVDDICLSTDSLFAYNYTYTGIAEINDNPVITVSPNPASDYVSINVSNSLSKYSLSLYNIYGQSLFRTENINTSHYSIDISNFPDGIFIVQIIFKEKIFNYKLIKQ